MHWTKVAKKVKLQRLYNAYVNKRVNDSSLNCSSFFYPFKDENLAYIMENTKKTSS